MKPSGTAPRSALWNILNNPEDVRYRWFHAFINFLIVVSVAIVLWDVLGSPTPEERRLVDIVDRVVLGIFMVEFLARLAVIRNWRPERVELTSLQVAKYWVVSRLKFIFSPWGFIDFLALLPLFPFLRSLRILRLLRLLRSVQFFRFTSPMQTLSAAFRDNSVLFTVAMGFVVGSIVISALMFFLAEKQANPNVNNLSDTMWWAIVTVTTVGFGDITPVTSGGKVVGAFLMLAGMFIIAMFAGVISSTLVGNLLPLRMEQVRMSSIADHIVIAGWNEEIPMMIGEMEREYGAEMPPLIVFADRPRPDNLPEKYVYVQGDFRRELEYEKVRVKYAAGVVVVADDGTGSEPAVRDASTVLTVFTIRSLEKKVDVRRTRPLHVVAEILDPENHAHAEVAGADEVIETSRIGSSLLAHTAGNPGVGQVISNLVLASRNNVYSAHLPGDFMEGRKMTFEELQDRGRDELGVLVIGIVHEGAMQLNPEAYTRVFANDLMVYIGPKSISKR